MNVRIRAVTTENSEATEGSLINLFQQTLPCRGIKTLEFDRYHKIPSRKAITLMVQLAEMTANTLFESAGSNAVWQSEREIIFDSSQSSVLKIEGIYWLNLEVME
jgi:hypothetical protein